MLRRLVGSEMCIRDSQAGAVRGMELDINNDWSIGYYYTHDGGPGSTLSRPTWRWWPKLVADPGQAVFARTWVPSRPRVGSPTAHLPAGAGPVSAQVEGDEVAALGREVVGGAFALLVPVSYTHLTLPTK